MEENENITNVEETVEPVKALKPKRATKKKEEPVIAPDEVVPDLPSGNEDLPDNSGMDVDDIDASDIVESESMDAEGEAEEPVREDMREGVSLYEATKAGRSRVRQDTRYTDRMFGNASPIESDYEKAQRFARDLQGSYESGAILTGQLAGSIYISSREDKHNENSRDPKFIGQRVMAVIMYGNREVWIPYDEFLHEGQKPIPADKTTVNRYKERLTTRINSAGTCPDVDFVVTKIVKIGAEDTDTDNIRYIASRKRALKALALREYAGVWQGKEHVLLRPNILKGRAYPARIIGRNENNIICELAGYVFPILTRNLCYSRRPEQIHKVRMGENGYIYTWVTDIQYNKETKELKCAFTTKNPYESDVEAFIRTHNCVEAHSDDNVTGTYGSSMSYRAEIVTVHSTGIYVELIDYPGVQVSCRYSDFPGAVHIKVGDQLKVRVSNFYRKTAGGEYVMLGRIDRIPQNNRSAMLL